VHVGAHDGVVAVQERVRCGEQEVREPSIQERVVDRVGVAELAEERIETRDAAGAEAARELAAGIAPRQLRRGPCNEPWAEHRPPQLMVRRFVHEHVVLTSEQPRQGARGQVVAPLVQQVGRRPAYHEVELELGVTMRARWPVDRSVARDATLDTGAKSEILKHRKKR
jgi:hypothetical protein